MMLPVTDDEERVLAEILDEHLRAMRMELAHTDDRAYRSDLRDRYDHVEKLRNRLQQLAAGEEAYV